MMSDIDPDISVKFSELKKLQEAFDKTKQELARFEKIVFGDTVVEKMATDLASKNMGPSRRVALWRTVRSFQQAIKEAVEET